MKITDLQVFVWFNLLFGVEAVFLYVLHIIIEFAGLEELVIYGFDLLTEFKLYGGRWGVNATMTD